MPLSHDKSILVQLVNARKAAMEAELGPRLDMPRPCVRLARPKPSTPPGHDSSMWFSTANALERPAATRLLQSLQARLEREQCAADEAEQHLGRRSFSQPSLSLNEQAKALSIARTSGLYPKDAAGRPAPKQDWRDLPPKPRPRRARPLSAGGAPWGLM